MYKVLVVDDAEDSASYLQTLLKLEGYTVGIASIEWEVLDVIENLQPDIVLLDLSPFDMIGYAILECLRQNPKLVRTGVVVTTASCILSEQEAIAAGANAFMQKPLDSNQVLTIVENLCDQKSETSEDTQTT